MADNTLAIETIIELGKAFTAGEITISEHNMGVEAAMGLAEVLVGHDSDIEWFLTEATARGITGLKVASDVDRAEYLAARGLTEEDLTLRPFFD